MTFFKLFNKREYREKCLRRSLILVLQSKYVDKNKEWNLAKK